MPEALPYPPPAYFPPPKKDNLVLIIVLVVVLLVLVPVIMAAALYAMVSGLIGNGPMGPLPSIAAAVSKSSNGSYWIVTFTSVPNGMTPTGTDVSLATSASLAAVPPTPLSALPGGSVTMENSLGTLYLAYHGAVAGTVRVGDTVFIGTSTSSGASTTGYNLQITWNGSFFNTSLS